MRFEEVYKALAGTKYYVFSCEDLCAFFPAQKKTTVQQYLCRWKKSRMVSSLRRDLYELTFPHPYGLPDMHLANKIYAPSYVSLETALSHYGMIPEVSMAVTSITARPTRRFKNSHGLFIYHSIRTKAFCGYTIEDHNGFPVLIAEPEKALADYFYFKTLRGAAFDIEEARLDQKKVLRLDRKKLDTYGRMYGIDMKGLLHDHL